MLTLAAYAGYVCHPFAGCVIAAALLFARGLMCKPMLVTFFLRVRPLDHWPLGAGMQQAHSACVPGMRHTERACDTAPGGREAAVSAPGGRFVRGKFLVQQGAFQPIKAVSIPWRIGNAIVSYAAYLGQFFCPINLAVLFLPCKHAAGWKVVGPLLVLVGVSVESWPEEMSYLLVGWLWYLGMLVLVIGVVQVGPSHGRPLHVPAADRAVLGRGLGSRGRLPVRPLSLVGCVAYLGARGGS